MNSNIPGNTEQPKTLLQLFQDVVAAQVRQWDARLALEKATTPDGEYSDRANDQIIEYVNLLAAGLDGADEAYRHVTNEHLRTVLSLSNQ